MTKSPCTYYVFRNIVPALFRPNCTSHRKIFASTVGVSMAHYREAGVDLFSEGHRFTPTPNPGHDYSRSCHARLFTRPTLQYRIQYQTIFLLFVVVKYVLNNPVLVYSSVNVSGVLQGCSF